MTSSGVARAISWAWSRWD